VASPLVRADSSIEIRNPENQDGWHGGGLGSALELSDFPSPNFLVEVDFGGYSTGGGKVRYFMISGRGTFNRGTKYMDERQFPTATQVDIDVVPVTYSLEENSKGSLISASAIRILPMQIRRDIKLGVGVSAAVRLVGAVLDREGQVAGMDPRFRAFAQVAVDLIGLRMIEEGLIHRAMGVVREERDGQTYLGLDLGSVKAQTGASWDLGEKVALRLSLNLDLDAAVVGTKDGTHAVATMEAFTRVELILKTVLQRWSIYADLGSRAILSGAPAPDLAAQGDLDHRVGAPYGYLQIGVRGTFQ
jgi:hypothetical protein